ncbi:GCN5 family acetyltransferase [Mycobacterium sp. E1319]|uniref:N-acetylglutamate synthase, CG3035 family n=1 Tax=Mycobacterium sp. E1319 TaxID=1834124 RepID=UPI0007FF8A4C|nr:GCN5 family acetyltransferase [Mycobacterium sp. E1319]OBH25995.1 GCN5 family acetyltransferase [Mycobacterium sp. E1319]
MISWPCVGTRVTVRYRRAPGSVPPLTDAVGRLLAADPVVRVRIKTGAVVECAPDDVVAVRVLTDAPVRTSQIRAVEHAAAAAWPGAERDWLDGWLLRAGPGGGVAANSAVALDLSAHAGSLPAIARWYRDRGQPPVLAVADRLLRLPPGLTEGRAERVLVRDVPDAHAVEGPASVTVSARPDDAWLAAFRRGLPVEVLTAVLDGELAFARHGAAGARAAVTAAPDGSRWLGLSALSAADDRSAAALCDALLSWGAARGVTRAHARTPNTGASALLRTLGFRPHHARRYIRGEPGGWDIV